MGNNYLRKLYTAMGRWTDPDAPKHAHDFSVPAIVILHSQSDHDSRYLVKKCRYCHSFRSVRQEGSMNGLITDQTSIPIPAQSYVKMYFKTSHKFGIDFHDMMFVKEET